MYKQNDTLTIFTHSLKSLLYLFNKEAAFECIMLGDTWHPASGYVDETILEGKKSVKEIIELEYDFRGLIAFEGKVQDIFEGKKQDVFIRLACATGYHQQEYELTSNSNNLWIIKDAIRIQNNINPNTYDYR